MSLITFFYFLTFLGFPLLFLIFISNFLIKVTPLQAEFKRIKENLYFFQPTLVKHVALLQEAPQLPHWIENLKRMIENSEKLIEKDKVKARKNLQEAFNLLLKLQPYFKNTKYQTHLFRLQASLTQLISLELAQ